MLEEYISAVLAVVTSLKLRYWDVGNLGGVSRDPAIVLTKVLVV
jgi:uncharacterized membrane protein